MYEIGKHNDLERIKTEQIPLQPNNDKATSFQSINPKRVINLYAVEHKNGVFL